MARVTVEDCLEIAPNRFALVHLAAKRAMMLKKDAEPLLELSTRKENKEVVTALREVAARKITFDADIDDVVSGRIHRKERKRVRRRRRV
jgi:DNA-directed RNA polymerase subunit omega